MRQIANLLHEISQLSKTPRTGFAFLGTGQQSVAEHTYTMTMICWVLADMADQPVNRERLLLLSLCHDLPEARTGDLNYVYKKYCSTNNKLAMNDLPLDTKVGSEIHTCITEYEAGETYEAKLAHDADQIELLLILKQEYDTGNPRAMVWYDNAIQRITTDAAQKLAQAIRTTPSDEWWMANPKDPHWVHGGK